MAGLFFNGDMPTEDLFALVDRLEKRVEYLKEYTSLPDLPDYDLIDRFSAEERIYVYNKYQGHCGICGDFVPMDAFTVDHIKPLSKGGTYEKENLQCACRSCNLMKQDILPDDMMEKIIKILDYQVGRKTSGKKHKKIKKHLKKVRGIVLS